MVSFPAVYYLAGKIVRPGSETHEVIKMVVVELQNRPGGIGHVRSKHWQEAKTPTLPRVYAKLYSWLEHRC